MRRMSPRCSSLLTQGKVLSYCCGVTYLSEECSRSYCSTLGSRQEDQARHFLTLTINATPNWRQLAALAEGQVSASRVTDCGFECDMRLRLFPCFCQCLGINPVPASCFFVQRLHVCDYSRGRSFGSARRPHQGHEPSSYQGGEISNPWHYGGTPLTEPAAIVAKRTTGCVMPGASLSKYSVAPLWWYVAKV